MSTINSIETNIIKIKKTFSGVQDDVLDEYNKGTISKKEMINILKWCEKMKIKLIKQEEGY